MHSRDKQTETLELTMFNQEVQKCSQQSSKAQDCDDYCNQKVAFSKRHFQNHNKVRYVKTKSQSVTIRLQSISSADRLAYKCSNHQILLLMIPSEALYLIYQSNKSIYTNSVGLVKVLRLGLRELLTTKGYTPTNTVIVLGLKLGMHKWCDKAPSANILKGNNISFYNLVY